MTEEMKAKIEAECEESCHPATFETAIDWYLKNLWHDASEEPRKPSKILVLFSDGSQGIVPYLFSSPYRSSKWVKWAYLDDLLSDTIQGVK